MQLIELKKNVSYIASPVNLGVLHQEQSNQVILIDTGVDDSAARKVMNLLQGAGLELAGIIVTHAHADHYGGAQFIVKRYNVPVYAARLEKSIMENPILEPLYLFGGANPPKPLRHKFLYAPDVLVNGILSPGKASINGIEMEVVDLKGHSLEQIGICVSGVLFCADSIVSEDVLDKHAIPLNADIRGALESYARLEERADEIYVPSHGAITDDIKPVVKANRQVIEKVITEIFDLCGSPVSAENLVTGVLSRMGAGVTNTAQYYLMNLTIMAYLSYLMDEGKLAVQYVNNQQLFSVKNL